MTHFTSSPASASIGEIMDLSGRTAVVTGAARGIGLGVARRLYEAGANVVLSDINKDNLAGAAAEFEDSARIRTVVSDVSKPEDADAMVRTAVEEFGALDIMVNNAGIFEGAMFVDVSLEVARRTLEVNLLGVMLCSQAASRQMIEQGRGGRIITVNSVESVTPSVLGLSHYGASKAGVAGMIKWMALELAPHGISVNNVCPGGTKTPGLEPFMDDEGIKELEKRIPLGRIGQPDDIGRAVLFLATDLAAHITGIQIVVDGGQTLRGAAV
ncbi:MULTISPECIES: SDR family NAD(P)-dependent oxidoreductase [unclassified Streptomyces]|uniref:SDR family NAD(P)-dependent oxidoreductase n=1 Tax=unclassified Streptomyces TaxID=2593676 RepID=UPI0001D06BA2|nr:MULTISPECIES: SDR family oxidoreductase [unclassified Streptomyces]MYS45121.1 glucose 1-dehydrogenase [Streptomyces sp. SID5998]MYX46176.1 glucose 1-dehydrogenase [Streptomyces sp. SID89]NED73755.1 SDR family oxidoreductase [Streptomyces sp. SID9944]EFF89073.1 short chain dehydrogenase/reductase family oxidoreductase [Streptomyces sp. e14]NED34766.1 SDR family oxidoreductase [Streptomyces sp. SID8499]